MAYIISVRFIIYVPHATNIAPSSPVLPPLLGSLSVIFPPRPPDPYPVPLVPPAPPERPEPVDPLVPPGLPPAPPPPGYPPVPPEPPVTVIDPAEVVIDELPPAEPFAAPPHKTKLEGAPPAPTVTFTVSPGTTASV